MKLNSKSNTANKGMTQAANDDNNSNKLDYFLLSQQVSALCSQIDDMGISGMTPAN
jgi:hypothetical protein